MSETLSLTNGEYTTNTFIKETNLKSITHIGLDKDILDSYTRTWIDRSGVPYKYEFRGEYQAYHNPKELLVKHNLV